MSTPIGKILRVNGFSDPFETMSNDKFPTLKEMQQAIGGYIERVRLSQFAMFEDLPIEPLVMIVDEEGLVRKKQINVKASMLAQNHIVGDVIVMPSRYFR